MLFSLLLTAAFWLLRMSVPPDPQQSGAMLFVAAAVVSGTLIAFAAQPDEAADSANFQSNRLHAPVGAQTNFISHGYSCESTSRRAAPPTRCLAGGRRDFIQ